MPCRLLLVVNQFNGRVSELLNIKTSNLIEPNKEVLGLISTKKYLYQGLKELCYIMTTTLGDDSTVGNISSLFTNQLCNNLGDWWTVCEFEKPVFISLAGLCNDSPVDRIYSLVEQKEGKNYRYGTFVGITGWVVDYSLVDNAWKITHYIFRDNDLILSESN